MQSHSLLFYAKFIATNRKFVVFPEQANFITITRKGFEFWNLYLIVAKNCVAYHIPRAFVYIVQTWLCDRAV